MQTPLITLTAPSLDGGIGRNLVNLAGSFIRSDLRVNILVEKEGDPNLERSVPPGTILSLPTTHMVGGLPFLSSYLVRKKPVAILTPVIRHTVLALRSRWATRSNTKIFVNVHNTYSKLYSLLPERKMILRLKRVKAYYPKCDAIVAVSHGVADDFNTLTGIPRESIQVIHNPIVSPDLLTSANEDLDHPWFDAGQPPVILGVGRLVEAKNFSLLLNAFDLVRADIPCRCLVVGDGHLRADLESQASESAFSEDIQFVGHKANPFPYMNKAAVFVMSSSWEGFGNVLVEAMATGTPVVSTNCPSGPSEILQDGKYGRLVAGDPVSLAKEIQNSIASPFPRDLTLEGAARFGVDHIAGKYLNLFLSQ